MPAWYTSFAQSKHGWCVQNNDAPSPEFGDFANLDIEFDSA